MSFKLIIAGTRFDWQDTNLDTYRNKQEIYQLLKNEFIAVNFINEVTEIVSGTARGIDRLGEELAQEHAIPVKKFPADWNRFNKAAGPIRNREMGEYADGALILCDGISTGSLNMFSIMQELRKPVKKIIC